MNGAYTDAPDTVNSSNDDQSLKKEDPARERMSRASRVSNGNRTERGTRRKECIKFEDL
jgi:hypothetical protein